MAVVKKILILCAGIFIAGVSSVCSWGDPSPLPIHEAYAPVKFLPDDRILILAPHPDDEMLACAGVIQEAAKRGLPVRIVFLTYGDNNQWSFLLYRKHPVLMPKAVQGMGLLRHDEAIAAAGKLGLSASQLTFLGYPDFRTLEIWRSHWDDSPPEESMLTHVNAVPYANALRPGALYKGDEVLKDIETVMREFKPTKIFVSHPFDHNPDHQSLYLFTKVALWDMEGVINPVVYPYLVHYVNWPQPVKFDPLENLTPPAFLKDSVQWQGLDLSPEEVANKHEALKEHRSQYQSSTRYLRLFIRANELFGDYPVVHLKEATAARPLVEARGPDFNKVFDQLLEEEKASFVGVESTFVGLENRELIFTVRLSRPLGKAVGLSIFAFGYKKDMEFSRMPKIHIQFGALEHAVLDQNKRVDAKDVHIIRKAKDIVIRIPLKLLGDPDRVLTSAKTYIGNVPLDWVAWRVLQLSD
ncbi:MAG: PIG-L family deacetylase [Candidatus Omnitrophica bacterium]|nr:PIG-L family deacetylase [Candidatus Omnitrophota bacterium]